MTNNVQQLAYPGVYPNENETIPYSPRRRQFDFMHETTNDRTIKLESMKDMSIDQIVELYKNGYRIEEMSQTSQTSTIKTADITVSSGAIFLIGAGILAYIILKR